MPRVHEGDIKPILHEPRSKLLVFPKRTRDIEGVLLALGERLCESSMRLANGTSAAGNVDDQKGREGGVRSGPASLGLTQALP